MIKSRDDLKSLTQEQIVKMVATSPMGSRQSTWAVDELVSRSQRVANELREAIKTSGLNTVNNQTGNALEISVQDATLVSEKIIYTPFPMDWSMGVDAEVLQFDPSQRPNIRNRPRR